MTTQFKQAKPRAPLQARPRPDADVAKIVVAVTERFSSSLEYLGR